VEFLLTIERPYHDFTTACRSRRGKPVSIKRDKVSGKTVKAQWYDPRKMMWLAIGEYANTGTREVTAPSRGEEDDWVLVLEDAALVFPPRGSR
jgi:hypothetical protein